MKKFYKYILILLLTVTLVSLDYLPQIREPFEEYEIEQILLYPAKASIDWNNLPYDDPYFGWYYKQLWWLYHSDGTETPPWMNISPINDEYILLFFIFFYLILQRYILKNKYLI